MILKTASLQAASCGAHRPDGLLRRGIGMLFFCHAQHFDPDKSTGADPILAAFEDCV